MKKRDWFSLIIYIHIGVLLGCLIAIIKQPTIAFFDMIRNYSQIFDNSYTISNDYFSSLVDYISQLKLVLVGVINILCMCLITKCKIRRLYIFYICEFLQAILFSVFFVEARYILFLVILMLILMNIFFPLGSGIYFELFKYIYYIWDISENEEVIDRKWKWKVFGVCISCIGFVVVFKTMLPVFTNKLLVLLFVSIVLLMWINSSKRKLKNCIKTILVYAIIIPFVLLSNNFFEVTVQNIVLVMISIFFAIERVINNIKTIIQEIKSESLKYLLKETNSGNLLIKEKINIDSQVKDHISDKMLIRQIIIYWKLGLEETKTLIGIYRQKKYTRDSMLIDTIQYYCEQKNNSTLYEKKEILRNICERNKEDIFYLPIMEEYAQVLYWLKEEYSHIFELLKDTWVFISDDTKYVFYYACKTLDMHEAASSVKREIQYFEQVEEKMKYVDEEEYIK